MSQPFRGSRMGTDQAEDGHGAGEERDCDKGTAVMVCPAKEMKPGLL